MYQQLAMFEGIAEKISTLKISGTHAGERVGRFDYGEEVYLVVKAQVTKISHGAVGELFCRQQEARVAEMVVVDPKDGLRMLEESKALADERFGLAELFRQGDVHVSVGEPADNGDEDDDGDDGGDDGGERQED